MPIPSKDAARQIIDSVRKVRGMPPAKRPGAGDKLAFPRQPAYHGFVRILGERTSTGHYQGVVTEHDGPLDLFIDRDDVPVWVRTPTYDVLNVWRDGDTNGAGVYWGRCQDCVEVLDNYGTATLPTSLPLYVVDDTGASPYGTGTHVPGTGTGAAAQRFIGVRAYTLFTVTFDPDQELPIPLAAEAYDTDNFHTPDTGTGVGSDIFTVPAGMAGYYAIMGNVEVISGTALDTAVATLYAAFEGVDQRSGIFVVDGGTVSLPLHAVRNLVVGDQVGMTLQCTGTGGFSMVSAKLQMYRIAPL